MGKLILAGASDTRNPRMHRRPGRGPPPPVALAVAVGFAVGTSVPPAALGSRRGRRMESEPVSGVTIGRPVRY